MAENLKISFVIPAHNEEACIKPCLESIQRAIEASRADAEIIVVNNASTDKTREILSDMSGITIVDEPELGLSRARQSGFLASSGDLIANVDADTIMPEAWPSFVLYTFKEDPELIALSGPQIHHDIPRSRQIMIRAFYHIAYLSYLLNRFVLRTGSLLQGGNFVIRRSALETIGGFDTRFTFWGEDTDMARRLHKIGKVRFTLKLPINASGRRLMAHGMVRSGVQYAVNYVWAIFLKRPYSTQVKHVRR